MSVQTVIDNLGSEVPVSSYPQTFVYNSAGQLTQQIATDPSSQAQWTQTFTYSGSNLTQQSTWVRTK